MQKIEKFGIVNPLCLLLEKPRKEFTREDIIKAIEEFEIERITFHYTALDGKIKELKIPICSRAQAELILTEGERVDGSSLFKGIVDAGKSDLYVIPVYKTAFINPFDNRSIDFMCRFLTANGELADYTPDSVLQKSANLLKERTSLELHALGELEFFLVGEEESKNYPFEKQKGYHQSAPYSKITQVLDEILTVITQIVGNVKYAHNEVGVLDNIISDYPELSGKTAEQVEIEFLLSPIEDTGDIITLSKWIIRNVAHQYGYSATFVPKIEIGHAGNGMHYHMALMKDGKNIMVQENGSLSNEARMVIGGLCTYAPSLTAFGNMVSASYLRLVPHQEAPTKVCWSECNRSALIRVPLGWTNVSNLTQKVNPQQKTLLENKECRQTVELRSPDGSAFVHFLLAGITLAAEWGLNHPKEALELAETNYVAVNIHSSANDHLSDLPTSCSESAELLLKEKELYVRDNIFTQKIIDNTASLLQNENDREMNQRLFALPDEERLIESRRIMHRAIHKH